MCKTCNKRTYATILATFFVIVALALAILVSFWRQQTFIVTLNVSHFFDIMLPTLAVGALIKYLFTHHSCHDIYHEQHASKETAATQKINE